MEACALTSGSSGNCFFIANKSKDGILIDAGISARQIANKLELIGRKPENIKALFITHEHIDHIRGVDVFARNFNVPIYATKNTIKNSFLCSNTDLINVIKNNESISVLGMEIEAFKKFHDASDPISFNIHNGKSISIITDAGHVCKNIIKSVKDSDFLFIEANHDIDMLESGPYPYHLKASLCVLEHASSKLKGLVLAHLSKTNNSPKLALNEFNIIKERKDLSPSINLSLRESPTALFRI